MLNAVYRVLWTESEAGWGQRPDGYSLHKTLGDAEDYVRTQKANDVAYWQSQGKPPGYVPDEYSFADKPVLTEVDEETYLKVQSEINVRVFRQPTTPAKSPDEIRKQRIAEWVDKNGLGKGGNWTPAGIANALIEGADELKKILG